MHKLACLFARKRSSAAARRFTAFIRDNRGVTAVEFAMVAFPFTLLMGGIFEDGLAYFRVVQLQNVAENAARKLRLGSVASMSPQQFQNTYVCTSSRQAGTLGSMFDCSKVVVVISSASNWNGASWGTPSNMAGASTSSSSMSPPLPDQVGTLLVMYKAPILFTGLKGLLGKLSRDDTTYYPMGKAAFRVEPSS